MGYQQHQKKMINDALCLPCVARRAPAAWSTKNIKKHAFFHEDIDFTALLLWGKIWFAFKNALINRFHSSKGCFICVPGFHFI